MSFPVFEHVAKSARHTTFYLSCGAASATPIIFLHGWPELSISWREQFPVFAALGFRAIAPDMRGYGRSSVYTRHEDYALETSSPTWSSLLDALGAEKAIWVGHDWGSPVVWSIAQHHPGRCHGVANLCVPYIPEASRSRASSRWPTEGLSRSTSFPQRSGTISFSIARISPRRGRLRGRCPRHRQGAVSSRRSRRQGKPARLAFVRANGGWFGGGQAAPIAARRRCAHRGGRAPLCRRAGTERVFRAGQLVHEW